MADWRVSIPYTDPAQSPIDALTSGADAALEDPEERRVAAHILLHAGHETVGDLLEELEGATVEQRRAFLDRTREELGLETASKLAAREEFRRVNQNLVNRGSMRDSQGRAPALCSAPDCTNFLPDDSGAPTGPYKMLPVKRWWCARHEHLAGPDDFKPWTGPRLAYSPSGAIVDLDEQEREAERARMQQEALDAAGSFRTQQEQAEGEQARRNAAARREGVHRESWLAQRERQWGR